MTIAAIAVGNRADAVEVLDFAARGIIKTQFRIEKMDRLTEVSENLRNLEGLVMAGNGVIEGSIDYFFGSVGFSRDEGRQTYGSCDHRFAVKQKTAKCLNIRDRNRDRCVLFSDER